MKPMKLVQGKYGVWEIENGYGRRVFTIFTKDEHCGRGEYAEEIDVRADNVGQARRIANQVLKAGYEPGLRIARVDMVY